MDGGLFFCWNRSFLAGDGYGMKIPVICPEKDYRQMKKMRKHENLFDKLEKNPDLEYSYNDYSKYRYCSLPEQTDGGAV